ncbi:histidine kinase [Streptomyces sp. NBC_00704]|uniref:sensor histidine kinase n=1 Tax=Streptomyces sp. NBC_00704 TaxID=2975809 RepID=UPI002E34CF67|nr:histidine kinase [Streptomyces sp. NBC_00704]
MQATTTPARRRGEQIMRAIHRDPRAAPRPTRTGALPAAATAVLAVALALAGVDGPRPDALGWTLLLAAHVPLVRRRRSPVAVLFVLAACVVPYHVLGNAHAAPVPATMVALYTIAETGPARRTLLTGGAVLGLTLVVSGLADPGGAAEVLRISGWVVAVLFCGMSVRYYRQYVGAIVERAERAERTREEEARRRVAEERLRIARDLHDLLAHSITLIGVQTSVAAHVLAADPDRLDRAAVAKALDDIAETCRSARGELRTTLEVLRENGVPDGRGPLPGLHGLPDLVESARTAGARAELSLNAGKVPPAVGAAAYRIVQEALTNAVRHGGRAGLAIAVRVDEREGALRITVTDDGTGAVKYDGDGDGEEAGGTGGNSRSSGTGGIGGDSGDSGGADAGPPGFGLTGMRERARSVGGTLRAGPRNGDGEGFEVCAVLPTEAAR